MGSCEQQSCGWGVPKYTFEKSRSTLTGAHARMEALDVAAPGKNVAGGLRQHWGEENFESLDGLPAYDFARKLARERQDNVEWGRGKGGLGLRMQQRGKGGDWAGQFGFLFGTIFGVGLALLFVQSGFMAHLIKARAQEVFIQN